MEEGTKARYEEPISGVREVYELLLDNEFYQEFDKETLLKVASDIYSTDQAWIRHEYLQGNLGMLHGQMG